MKALVCGGRDYDDDTELFNTLDLIHKQTPIDTIIHGGARGADDLAGWWAVYQDIQCITVPADWNLYGRRAGPIRNAQMLELKPDVIVAFKGGNGTRNMIALAEKANVPVITVNWIP